MTLPTTATTRGAGTPAAAVHGRRTTGGATKPAAHRRPRLVQDDTSVRSTEHAKQDRYLLDIVARLVASACSCVSRTCRC